MSYVISRRCDEPMRRSKENCFTPNRYRWKCTNDCKECICCIYMDDQFKEHHVNFLVKREEERTYYER